MHFILEAVAIGNASDARQAPIQFGAFLNVSAETDVDPALFGDRPYLKIPIKDMQAIPVFQLQEAVEFIDRHIPGKRLLIFCDGGVGRAPSVMVAYLCSKGMRFGQAVEFVAVRKPFMSILPELIESIRKASGKPVPVWRPDPLALPSNPAIPDSLPSY